MHKYIQTNESGKGFITHEDQEQDGLSFSCRGNIVAVEGDENKIDTWVTRVNGEIIEESIAIRLIKVAEKEGLKSEITNSETNLSQLKSKLAVLEKK